ncbi:hypothetical protein GCM10027296_25910 [Chitinimonas naiadis]
MGHMNPQANKSAKWEFGGEVQDAWDGWLNEVWDDFDAMPRLLTESERSAEDPAQPRRGSCSVIRGTHGAHSA